MLLHVGMFWLLNSGMSHRIVDVVLGPDRDAHDRGGAEERRAAATAAAEDRNPAAVRAAAGSVDRDARRRGTDHGDPDRPRSSAGRAAAAGRRAAPQVPRTAPNSDPRRPLTQPEYPPSSRRAGEAGTVILEVYVLENGRVGDARVKQSSGFPSLDEAAVREVKRSWRLVPGTENGKPVPMWGQFAVTFKLTD